MRHDSNRPEDLLHLAIAAAEEAGRVILESQGQFDVLRAEGKDLKSAADLSAERIILERLETTGLAIVSEETRTDAAALREERCWIIDPLDGTLNYTRGLPIFCLSIALWQNGRPLLGVIHDPNLNVTYSGIVGQGMTMNSLPAKVSAVTAVEQAVLCTGFPSGRSYDSAALTQFVSSVQRFKKVRLLGSAALCLAHLAAGHVDAYCEEDIWLWDVAAGLALVEAAGGQVHYGPWSHELKSRVYATNGANDITQIFMNQA